MAVNNSETALSHLMVTRLELDELKLNINDMFLIINGIIISCEYLFFID
jgi:hypothetical protein